MSLTLFLAAATSFAQPDAIDREVAQFTGAAIGQSGGAAAPVDRRLRLNACGTPLALAWLTARRDTVLVQCPGAGGWKLYVPVTAPAASGAGMVSRGDAVTIAIEGEGFSVSEPGEAIDGGGEGDWIRVRPAAPGTRGITAATMRARIVRPGLVALAMP